MAEAAQQIGIQMYTLRDQTERDFLGTLAKVAEMGYQAVEFAGYFGVSAGNCAVSWMNLAWRPLRRM